MNKTLKQRVCFHKFKENHYVLECVRCGFTKDNHQRGFGGFNHSSTKGRKHNIYISDGR